MSEQKHLNEETWPDFLRWLFDAGHKAMSNVLKEWKFIFCIDDNLVIQKGKNCFSATYLDDPERFERFKQAVTDFCGRAISIEVQDHRPTFDELAEKNPVLRDLERTCELLKFDAENKMNRQWYGTIKPVLVQNVGWSSPYPELKSCAAYDVVYRHLIDKLAL